MHKSDEINELATAMAAAQGELENATKKAENPAFKRDGQAMKYADLAEVLNTVRPVFAAHGLSIVQMPSFADGVAHVETILMHKSGQWISNVASAPVGKQDAQGVGSVITYLRRYSSAAFAGIAQEDDDANASIKPDHKTAPKAGAKSHNNVNEIFEVAIKAISNAMDAESLKSHYEAAKTMCSNQPEADRVMKVRNDRAKMLREMEDTGKHDDAGDRV